MHFAVHIKLWLPFCVTGTPVLTFQAATFIVDALQISVSTRSCELVLSYSLHSPLHVVVHGTYLLIAIKVSNFWSEV